MKPSIIVDTAFKAIDDLCEMVEMYANVEESIEVSTMFDAAKMRIDRIQGHPQGRPQA